MTGNNWIFFLACAFSLAFACLLFFALYSRTIEPYDGSNEPSTDIDTIPRCTESDKLGGLATLGGDGNIYIIKNEELVCLLPRIKDVEDEQDEYPPTIYHPTTPSMSSPPYCVNRNSQKRKAGDGRLWGIENNMPCVNQFEK
jgi:hypothetical protein